MLWNLLLQDLDHYLQDKVYLAGNQFTLADIFMYYGIHPLIVSYFFHLFPSLYGRHNSFVVFLCFYFVKHFELKSVI